MVRINVEKSVNISINTIIENCSNNDLEELAIQLSKMGFARTEYINPSHRRMCPAEEIFEKELNKIHGSWSSLSKRDENLILDIAKKCI